MNFKDMKKLTDSPEAVKFMRKFNLKRVVAGRGHDCGGLLADLCVKSKVLVDFKDDGWGGEPELYFNKDAEAFLTKEFKDNNFAQLVFDNGHSFMEDMSRFNTDFLATVLVENLASLKEIDRIMKQTKRKLIYGTDYSFHMISWKGLKDLKDLPRLQLQRSYDKYKKQLKDGQKFFNTDEQLQSLGIQI